MLRCRHLNPAVSFALLVTGELPLVRCVLYVAAQLAGSSLACGALRIALPEHYFAQVNVNGSNFNFGVTMPSSSSDFEMCTRILRIVKSYRIKATHTHVAYTCDAVQLSVAQYSWKRSSPPFSC